MWCRPMVALKTVWCRAGSSHDTELLKYRSRTQCSSIFIMKNMRYLTKWLPQTE